MTARASPRHPTSGGAPTPPWPGPESTAGSGSLPASTTTPPRPGHMWPRWATASPPYTRSTARPGITDSPAFLGEPETNGCAERWIRTLKDQCLWVQLYDTVDELRQAVASFVDRYNSSWLIQRHGHHTPKEAYQAAQSASAA